MSDQAFAVSARPRPSVILRVPLLEYSLGHELLLLGESNPLLFSIEDFNNLDDIQQRRAVIRAVQICGRTWVGNTRPDKWLWVWERMIRGSDFALAIADFKNYRVEGSSFPRPRSKDLDDKDGDGRTLGAPFLARLAAFAGQCYGEQAFDMPMGMLQWMYFADAEVQGLICIENEWERKVREEIEQHQADYAKEQAAKVGM